MTEGVAEASGAAPSTRMPALFIGHGSPMNTLEHNRYTDEWRALGAALPRPRAVLSISAHWYINATAVTAMAKPSTIHDFFGFPDELFAFSYPAPGDPALAAEIVDIVAPTWVGLDRDSWGIDHGTWSVLAHLLPDAGVPVLQLAINATKPFDYHLELGRQLAPLRDRGVLILGSGNVVHNLGAVDFRFPDRGTPANSRFDEAARAVMTQAPGDAPSLQQHPDFRYAAPTPDHFIPLLYVAGLASAAGEQADVLIEGPAYGSLSMTSYTVGAVPSGSISEAAADSDEGVPPLPDVPADTTNL
jgi:4,5-DOPA dioxygenase extradiol